MSQIMTFSKLALKNLFSKPATTKYPAVPKEYPERTRGHIDIDFDDCILCGMCMRTCPPGAIKVDRNAGDWEINRFDCVQCGYCAEKCPKKCLHIVPGYQEPGDKKFSEKLHKDMPKPQAPSPEAIAAAKAKAEAAKAAKAAAEATAEAASVTAVSATPEGVTEA